MFVFLKKKKEKKCFKTSKNIRTLRLVDEFVSVDFGRGGVPGYLEAGVPLIRNTEISGAQHINCGKRNRRIIIIIIVIVILIVILIIIMDLSVQ